MIYRAGVLIDWKNPKSDDEVDVYNEITQIKNKYFAENTPKKVVLLYPKGEMKELDGGYTVPKLYPISYKSADGVWRYSASLKRLDGTFIDSARFIKDLDILTERDLEFLWFLVNRSTRLNKFVFIQDLETESGKELLQMAEDVDVRFMLLSDKSPIANDENTVRQMAEIFGVKDVDKKGIQQAKKELLNELTKGERRGDQFINYKQFDEFVEGESKRKIAFTVRACIGEGIVKYSLPDHAWYLMEGKEKVEKLLTLKRGEADNSENILIREAIDNPNVRSRLLSAIGEEENVTADDYRELSVSTLRKKVKDEIGDGVGKTGDSKEDLIKKLCDHHGVDYSQPSSK